MKSRVSYLAMGAFLFLATPGFSEIKPEDISLEFISGGYRNDIANLAGGGHGARVTESGGFEFYNEKPYAISVGISTRAADGTTGYRQIVIPPRTSGPIATAVDTVLHSPSNILTEYLSGDIGQSSVVVDDVNPEEVLSFVYIAGMEDAQTVNLSYGLASFVETTASLIFDSGDESSIAGTVTKEVINRLVSADNVAEILAEMSNGCGLFTGCKELLAKQVKAAFLDVLEDEAYQAVLLEGLARSGLSNAAAGSVLANLSGKTEATRILEFLAKMESYGDLAGLISGTVRFAEDPTMIGANTITIDYPDEPLVPQVNPLAPYEPPEEGFIPQYVELGGTTEQSEELVSYTATNPNTDLTNETVPEVIEEAEPETEPPVTTPLWAGRMSLTGRVNAGLNPATGVVGAMETSGDAPISEFILFNPETGTINTPLHGSQTSANIGHSFSHLIWGDWSGGSRTWTTSSYPVNQLSGFFVYGELTPPDARTTGTATYTGRLRGDIIENGNIHRGTAYGDFGLTANFGTGSLGGWLALADTDSSNYAFVSDIENAQIVGQNDRLTFGGDLTGEGIYSGRIEGYFFGPNATELGGTYEVAGEDGNSSSSGILLGWETGTMPDRPDNPTSTNFPLYVSYSSTSGAIFDRGDDGIGKTPEMGDTLTLTIDGTPTRVTEVYDTTNDQFDYTSWGGWTGGAPSSPFNEGYWVAGQETPSSVIENLTGTATYSGDIRGDYVSAGTRHDATGNINLTADFSNDRITGDMMFHAQTGNGSVSAGTLGLQSDIRSDGSFFQSTSSHGFQGNFYGPNAEEAGGTAWLTTNDGSFNGVFRANQ